jgi:hypothetical protein
MNFKKTFSSFVEIHAVWLSLHRKIFPIVKIKNRYLVVICVSMMNRTHMLLDYGLTASLVHWSIAASHFHLSVAVTAGTYKPLSRYYKLIVLSSLQTKSSNVDNLVPSLIN